MLLQPIDHVSVLGATEHNKVEYSFHILYMRLIIMIVIERVTKRVQQQLKGQHQTL